MYCYFSSRCQMVVCKLVNLNSISDPKNQTRKNQLFKMPDLKTKRK